MKELMDLFKTENVTGNNPEVCTYTTILVLFHLLSPLIDWQAQSIEVVREHIFCDMFTYHTYVYDCKREHQE